MSLSVCRSSCVVTVTFSDFERNRKYPKVFVEDPPPHKSHRNLTSGSRVFSYGQTDKYDETKNPFSVNCFVNTPVSLVYIPYQIINE
jgi:hypothetical protein